MDFGHDDDEIRLALEASRQSHREEEEARELERRMMQEILDREHAQALEREESRRLAEQRQIEDSLRTERRKRQERRDAELAHELNLVGVMDTSERFRLHEAEAERMERARIEELTTESRQGCWDCPSCTLRSHPYDDKCRACRSAAPAHILTFRPLPRGLRFGVELEVIVPEGKRDGLSCEQIAKNLNKMGVPTVYSGYTHEVLNDKWKMVTDSSLQGNSPHDVLVEFVSPPMSDEDGLAKMRALLENVRRFGLVVNSSCGFHVHVDAEEGSPLSSLAARKRLVQVFSALESAFDSIVARDDSRIASGRSGNGHRYCQSNLLEFGSLSNMQRWEKIGNYRNKYDLVSAFCPDRYRKLNLTNLTDSSRPNTVEFRQHGGVDKLLAAEAWVRLVLRFCHSVSDASNAAVASCQSLPQDENAERTTRIQLETLFRLVDCPGLESYYHADRRLYATSVGAESIWRCSACRRCFGTSRSLAQHAQATGHN